MPPPPAISYSPHPFMESLGPLPGSAPYLDMHADEGLCWRYTAIMVAVQVFAFGKVSDNRIARKSARAAKLEREKIRWEKLDEMAGDRKPLETKANGHFGVGADGACDLPKEQITILAKGKENGKTNGATESAISNGHTHGYDCEDSMTETSEEEMMI